MAKQVRYTIEVVINGETLYYQRSVKGVSYMPLDEASSTPDFYELGQWREYVKNDFDHGSVDSYQVVLLELKVKNANVDTDINNAIIAQALNKLSQLEKDALGL